MTVLAINAGSSTLKFALHQVEDGIVQPARLSGSIEGLEPGGSPLLSWHNGGPTHEERTEAGDADPFDQALKSLQRLLQQESAGRELQAVAHRVVHGGSIYSGPVIVDAEVLQSISSLSSLAPLHQPHNVDGIVALGKIFPELPQIACFDTTFHVGIAEEEYLFGLPKELSRQGIRRYGFHGLSYQFVSQALHGVSARAHGRVVMAHLGNGASLCAMHEGKSQATTMGFSALDGLMMGTRSGTLDAGVLLHLLADGWDHARLQDMLYRKSGLLGVSGISADMRRLRASSEPDATLAIQVFTHRVVRETGAMAACIGGLDVLVFTAGIGEHDGVLRAEVCDRLAFLGVVLDQDKNREATGTEARSLHAAASKVEVWVIPTDEARVAGQSAIDLLAAAAR